MSDQPNDGRNDFDFLIGKWRVHHRRLRERLNGSESWEEFESNHECQKVLNGLGNMDQIDMPREVGTIYGMTVRIFNPNTGQWSIHWADSKYAVLQEPMVGEFKDGVGEFYDHETYNGKGIFSRFIWTHATPDTAHWEQGFSTDGGKTWETNWTSEFKRIA